MKPDTRVTIPDAAKLIGRPVRTVYAWVADDRLASTKGIDGVTRVRYGDVVEVEARIRRGRRRTADTQGKK